MRNDYFKTLGMIMCVMYAFSGVLSLSFVVDKQTAFVDTIEPVVSFANLSLGVSFIVISLFFMALKTNQMLKQKEKQSKKTIK